MIIALLSSRSYSSVIENEYKIDQIEEIKTQITDLNNDIFYIIFSNLKFHDLVNIAEAIPEISSIIFKIIQRNYSELSIISFHFEIDSTFINNGRVAIFDLKLILATLKQFGECFQKITIDYQRFLTSELVIITEFLNKYTSKTLKQLEMIRPNENELDHLTVPFEEVQEFTCNIRELNNINGSTSWNYLFPKLQRLTIELNSVEDLSFIGYAFPHLEYVSLSIAETTWTKLNKIEQFFANNPQIKSIELKDFPIGFVKVIEPLLLNLEILRISASDIGNNTVHFEHVRQLEISTYEEGYVKGLSLPSLESLTMYYSTKSHSTWIEFFKRHRNLRQLILNDYLHEMSRTIGLNALTTDLKNLVDVTIRNYYYGSESIIQFIESHKELRKFCTSISTLTKPMEETFRQRFQNEWTITVNRQLCFERKNLI